MGGSIPLVWTYFAEFQPSTKRGGALSLLASFWMIGNITVAGLAWAIIPHQLAWDSWRVIFIFENYCIRAHLEYSLVLI